MSVFNKNEVIAYNKGYRVNDNGDLIGLSGKSIGSVSNGYHRFKIRQKVGYVNCSTHRLQAYQKYGDEIYKKGVVCRHLNGNPLDNSKENIVIGTQSDNMMDRKKEDRLAHSKLATLHWQKHNPNVVKKYYAKEKSYKKTMEHFNISSKGTLHYILNKAQ